MKSILENIISNSDLGFLPSVGVVVLTATMVAIVVWTYNPKNQNKYKKMSQLTMDEEA